MLGFEFFPILWYTDNNREVGTTMAVAATTKIDLLVLGLLLDRPMHGYELYQQIQAEEIETWFNVSMAGVYYSLGKLREQGLVAESRQGSGRSTRKSIYHLTEEGRAAFFEAMEAKAASHEKIYLGYDLIIYLLNKVPLQRAISLLEQHQAFLAEQAQEVRSALADQRAEPLQQAILDHRLRYLEMEQGWLADVARDIQGDGSGWGTESQAGRPGGLMILSGDLRHYHLPDLIRLIVSGRHSGTLTLSDGVQVRTLSFEEGRPVCATARRSDESPELPLSQEQVMEGICDLFRWQEGRFTLDQEMEQQEWCIPLHLDADELILRGCRWVDNWAIIQRLIPSADTSFELGMSPQRIEGLPLNEIERRIVAAVDGIKDVATTARELGLTVFEASRAFYCLAAVGVVRTTDLDKIRLRRVFREIAELMCSSTLAWRTSPEDRTCEDEVNRATSHLPLCLNQGRIEDQANPQLTTDEMVDMYRAFLQAQLTVVSQRFGREKARWSFERTLQQLAPELQEVASRYGLNRLTAA
jgi:DNA-binding PadR family transcriptional regulator